MGSLYGANRIGSVGNITFDKIYPNRMDMEFDLKKGEYNIFIGRYVLVDYGLRGSEEYSYNAARDSEKYKAVYDSTIWQITENGPILVSELNTPIPYIELVNIAPKESGYPTYPEFEKTGDLSYALTMAPAIGIKINNTDFNEEGFNSKISLPNDKRNNNISIDTTFGVGEKNAFKDTWYLDFNFQGLGTAMSDIWDIVYGKDRKQNISWGNTDGTRMIVRDENGYTTLNEQGVESLAGAINSVQDLMGQIIEKNFPEDLKENFSKNKIYYDEGKFYFINKTYTLKELEKNQRFIKVEGINSNTLTYEPNKFYYSIDSGLSSLYLESEKTYDKNRKYFSVIANKIEDSFDKYEPNKFYIKYDGGSYYEKSRIEEPALHMTYYTINEEEFTLRWYKPNLYIRGNAAGYLPAIEENYIPGEEYYVVEGIEYNELLNLWPKEMGNYLLWDPSTFGTIQTVNLTEFNLHDNYYKKVFDSFGEIAYAKIVSLPEENISAVYKLKEKPLRAYLPNTYYYKSNNNFFLDRSEKIDLNKEYYLLQCDYQPIFFEIDTYYEKDSSGEYVKTDDLVAENKDYYKKTTYKDLYVIEDPSGKYPQGYQWMFDITPPEEIKFGQKIESYEKKELKGFAESFNTIHGLIVNLQKIIASEDLLTRDTATIQGCINKLNDILIGFDKLQPNSFIVSDKYGYPKGKMIKQDSLIETNILQDEISIAHKDTEFKGSTYGINSTYINHGDGIKIPKISMGEKGHIYSIEDSTVYLNNKFPILDGEWVDGWFDTNGTAYLPGGMNDLRANQWQKILITVNDSMNFIFDTWSDGLYQRQSQVFDGVYYSLFLDDTSSTIVIQLQTGTLTNGTYSPVSASYRIRGIK